MAMGALGVFAALAIFAAILAVRASIHVRHLRQEVSRLRDRVKQLGSSVSPNPRHSLPAASNWRPAEGQARSPGSATKTDLNFEALPETLRKYEPAQVLGATRPPTTTFDISRVEEADLTIADLGETDPGFSVQHIQRLYTDWCRARKRPTTTTAVEIGWLQYVRAKPAMEHGGPPQHILRETEQLAEFVRFSPTDATTGLAFPNPDAHFTPVVAHLFPGLTHGTYTPEVLSTLKPAGLKRRDGLDWESL